MNNSARQTDVSEIRPLGARLTFLRHEWLPAALRRVGYNLGTPPKAIVQWCGLTPLVTNQRAPLANSIPASVARRLARGLGVEPDTFETMVMSHLPESLVALRPNGLVSQSKNWSRGAGTRYCPDCLAEHPGVYYTYWRLWWCFICERHNRILRDACPACHGDLIEANLRDQSLRDPSLCWVELADGGQCMHPLASAWPEPTLDPASPMLTAQGVLSDMWSARQRPDPSVSPATLRGVGIALIGAGDLHRIADLAEVDAAELDGLYDVTSRVGTTPPRDALAMGALLGAAYRLITEDETLVSRTIRDVTYERISRTDQYASAPWSARNFLDTWPGIDSRMRRRVLRALDRDLTPVQRLVHGSAASRQASEQYEALRRAAIDSPDRHPEAFNALINAPETPTSKIWGRSAVPPLLWPKWANPLAVDTRTDGYTLQRALADAVRIAGTGVLPDYDAITGIGKRLRPSMLGTGEQTAAILRQVSELALLLRARPGPIDYGERRKLDTLQLLRREDWTVICGAVGEEPGRQRKLRNAQRYAYMRMCATLPADLPERLRFQRESADVADYNAFAILMSAELQTTIDAYLQGWLQRFESPRPDGPRPVVWAPPRFRPHDADLALELDDIDVDALHMLLASGLTAIGEIARQLRRTPRHVRWAIAEHPVPTGRKVCVVDWADQVKDISVVPRTKRVG